MTWIAVWASDPARMYWQLTVTDEAGNVAAQEGTDTPVWSLHPREGFLVAIGLCPAGEWRRDEADGSFRCPVIAGSDAQQDALMTGLLAGQRSDPGTRVH